jgi:hypothetical protein
VNGSEVKAARVVEDGDTLEMGECRLRVTVRRG